MPPLCCVFHFQITITLVISRHENKPSIKRSAEKTQSPFRWCLYLSISYGSSHATKLSRSHLKGFQFINKNCQRSHLHGAYGYSPSIFPPNALYLKLEVSIYARDFNCISMFRLHRTSVTVFIFSSLCIPASSISQPFISTLESI